MTPPRPPKREMTASTPVGLPPLWNSAYALLTATALFWAGNSVVGRAAHDLVPPVALAFWRWTLAFFLIIGIAWPHLRRDLPLLRRHAGMMLLLSLLGIAAFNTLLYRGLHDTTALNSLLMQSAQPPIVLAFAFLIFRERASLLQFLGVLLSLCGVATIITRGMPSTIVDLSLNPGDALILLAVLLYALYSVLLRRRPPVHHLSFAATSFGLGALFILPLYVLELTSGSRIRPEPAAFAAIGYVAVFPSLIAYICFTRGVELIGAGRASQFMNLMPAFGALLAMLFLGERFHLFHAVGIGLVGAGILLAARRSSAI